ncbi:hypothetical protein GCM10009597_18770 [Peribacillus frigoritolerans]
MEDNNVTILYGFAPGASLTFNSANKHRNKLKAPANITTSKYIDNSRGIANQLRLTKK